MHTEIARSPVGVTPALGTRLILEEVWSGKLSACVACKTCCYGFIAGMSADLPLNAELQGSRKQCTNNQIMHVNTEEPPLLFLSFCLKILAKVVAERLAIWM